MKAFFKKLKYTPFEIADALVLDLINFYEFISFYGLKIFGKYDFLKRNEILKNNHKDQRIFLLGNSPSLNNFDLKKLSNEIVIMVNRSFMHEDYDKIKPKFHLILDSKMETGEWPIDYIEIILSKNPEVNLLLNAKWFSLDKFKKYQKNKNIFWIKSKSISLFFDNFNNNIASLFSSTAVVEQGLSLAIYLGSKKIYIMGVELNGILYLMNDKESHFNGKDPDYEKSNSWHWARAMNSSSRGIRQFHRINELCKKNGIELFNLSKTGLLDFIPKDNYETILKSDK